MLSFKFQCDEKRDETMRRWFCYLCTVSQSRICARLLEDAGEANENGWPCHPLLRFRGHRSQPLTNLRHSREFAGHGTAGSVRVRNPTICVAVSTKGLQLRVCSLEACLVSCGFWQHGEYARHQKPAAGYAKQSTPYKVWLATGLRHGLLR
jgi:hypothetical protein